MSRPLLYDVFSGAGGAAVGYDRAGFRVVGIDNRPQPRYPFDFVQMDAFDFFAAVARGDFEEPAAWHCSPPCQRWSALRNAGAGASAPALIDATRAALTTTGRPWVIENVPGAPLRSPVVLCGTMFGLTLYRHRGFEASFLILAPPHPRHPERVPDAGRGASARGFISVAGNVGDIRAAERAMGIDWMRREELVQSIPPAYTFHVGTFLMTAVLARRDAA